MANLQVKNVPEGVHRRLRDLARQEGRTMSEVVLELVERRLEEEVFWIRWVARPVTMLPEGAAADAVRESRAERDLRLSGLADDEES